MAKSIRVQSGDIFGGLAAMLVALPSAIAFGLVVFAPLGAAASKGALAGILGAITLGIVAPVFGGTPRLISAPCAPAAAVLAALVIQLMGTAQPLIPVFQIPALIVAVSLFAGGLQFLYGYFGGGRLIKYIPYPVVAGYLSGVGILIISGQLPKFLGIPKGTPFWDALGSPELWNSSAMIVGLAAVLVMILAPRLIRRVPAPILALLGGMAAYFALSRFRPELIVLEGNPLVIGPIVAASSGAGVFDVILEQFQGLVSLDLRVLKLAFVPALTLSVLLSIDTLKTCVVVDALTRSRHNSNRELIGQGLGNFVSAVFGGMPGAGTTGATLVNLSSGGVSRASGVLAGLFAWVAFAVFGGLVAWVPLGALAGILLVVGFRMIDRNSVRLLTRRSTVFDFVVVAAVVLTAVTLNLIAAAGVGLGLAILLFLRDQIRGSVVRRKMFGNRFFSKKRRLPAEMALLELKGDQTVVFELQGSLFFGTTDQLFSEIEPHLNKCRFVVFDMKRVQSVDFTAAHMLEQIEAQVADHHGSLIFANLPEQLPSGKDLYQYLDQIGLVKSTRSVKVFPDLDSALEWTEDQVLLGAWQGETESRPLKLGEIDFLVGLPEEALAALSACSKEKSLKKGEKVFAQGQKGDELFLIRRGEVKILLPLGGTRRHHLATFSRGDFFGDMAFLDKGGRSADAEASTDVELYAISRHEFDEVSARHSALSGLVFSHLARTLAVRLRQADMELRTLEES